MSKGNLYLVPSPIADDALSSLSMLTDSVLINAQVVIAENEKHARSFIKKTGIDKKLSDFEYYTLNEHTDKSTIEQLLIPLMNGKNAVIISEAGCPAIADPGSNLVALAHKHQIKVVPVSGPSSIFLTLMASGFNGQSFKFNGYLPKEQKMRIKKIKEMEKETIQTHITNLFMETPYRNNHVLNDLLNNCYDNTLLCIAANVTASDEKILTQKIADWKKQKHDYNKMPCIFALGVIL